MQFLENNKDITHVSMVHSETTSGLINPAEEICAAIKTLYP